MIGVILLLSVLIITFFFLFNREGDRSDIIDAAMQELEDAKAARKVASIQRETKETLAEAKEINKEENV